MDAAQAIAAYKQIIASNIAISTKMYQVRAQACARPHGTDIPEELLQELDALMDQYRAGSHEAMAWWLPEHIAAVQQIATEWSAAMEQNPDEEPDILLPEVLYVGLSDCREASHAAEVQPPTWQDAAKPAEALHGAEEYHNPVYMYHNGIRSYVHVRHQQEREERDLITPLLLRM